MSPRVTPRLVTELEVAVVGGVMVNGPRQRRFCSQQGSRRGVGSHPGTDFTSKNVYLLVAGTPLAYEIAGLWVAPGPAHRPDFCHWRSVKPSS